MKILFALMASVLLLTACGGEPQSAVDDLNVTSKFNSTWNVYEKLVQNSDGSITYKAFPWGGLVGEMKVHNMPVDWSEYESVTFDFAEPTTVPTQVMISNRQMAWARAGISKLTCYFDGRDVSSVDQVVLQAADSCSITVNSVYLTPNDGVWESTTIWTGNRALGDWADGFVVPAEKFNSAYEGNKLEILFTTDDTNPEVKYWLLKTIFDSTGTTLEGNASELNDWGCASLGKDAKDYRIVLTANDVKQLREHGLFVNGYYCNVAQCNLLRKTYY
ncbi:MAG: hypothetical protein IJ841_09525 [Prevotella sp.]|nr:hypothetical protein [Prevotella sp.]